MSTTLRMISGEDKSYPLQCWNEGSLSTPVFLADDQMTCLISEGEGQGPMLNPGIDWWTDPDPVTGLPTQTGFDQAQVLVHVPGPDSLAMMPEATYQLEVWRSPAGTVQKKCVWRGSIVAGYAAGAVVPRLPVYCRYDDMLLHAPWIRYVPDRPINQAGFYNQRLEARLWIDDLIVASFRSSALYPFGTSGVPAQMWSGWAGPWRSPMDSVWIRDQIWGGFVVGRPTVTNPGYGYTIPPVVTAPAPPSFPIPGLFQSELRAKPPVLTAVLNGTGGVGAVLVGDRGYGYMPGSTINLTFTGGGGTGAAATATISDGCVFRRDSLRRLATFKALSILGLAQIGANPQHVDYGRFFGEKVSEELTSFRCQIDINQDGYPDIAIPLHLTNTIYI